MSGERRFTSVERRANEQHGRQLASVEFYLSLHGITQNKHQGNLKSEWQR